MPRSCRHLGDCSGQQQRRNSGFSFFCRHSAWPSWAIPHPPRRKSNKMLWKFEQQLPTVYLAMSCVFRDEMAESMTSLAATVRCRLGCPVPWWTSAELVMNLGAKGRPSRRVRFSINNFWSSKTLEDSEVKRMLPIIWLLLWVRLYLFQYCAMILMCWWKERHSLSLSHLSEAVKQEKVSGQNNKVASLFRSQFQTPVNYFLVYYFLRTSYWQTECHRVVEIFGYHTLHDRF